MQNEKINALIIEDAETRHSQNLRYLTDMESDAVLILWNIILAEKLQWQIK